MSCPRTCSSPDALEVFLDTFEGPLDLLLYLIRRQQLDILNLPILQITAQYMEYVDLMQGLNLELAAEYLLMAAWLAEIKSRLLLPKAPELEDEEEGEDPASPSFVACRSTSATSWGRSRSMPCRGWSGRSSSPPPWRRILVP
jgi:hypothetical protein